MNHADEMLGDVTDLVGIHDWNEQVVEVPMATLISWKAALKLEVAGMQHSRQSVESIVRKALSVPDGEYSLEELSAYITASVDSILNQLCDPE